jgi:phosphoribosylformimino-5-aminoimidazole carboxamide ribotide isomerase
MSPFTVMPALDLRGGRVVRLAQGDFARETRYEDDPVTLARGFAAAGARWLHLVDLDGARAGGFACAGVLRRIRAETPLAVQLGGGVRGEADVAARLDAGAARVVVGTLAVREPLRVRGWLQRFGSDALCIALDARRDAQGLWRLPLAGWREDSGATLDTTLAAYRDSALRHVLCTDIDRDGMLRGPNLALYRRLADAWPALRILASGGVSSEADLAALRGSGAAAAVVGRALLEGRLGLAEALAC